MEVRAGVTAEPAQSVLAERTRLFRVQTCGQFRDQCADHRRKRWCLLGGHRVSRAVQRFTPSNTQSRLGMRGEVTRRRRALRCRA